MAQRTFAVSDRFYCDPQVVRLRNSVVGFWVRAGMWVAVQDAPDLPAVPHSVLARFSDRAVTWARQLVAAGLWESSGQTRSWRFRQDHDLYHFDSLTTTRPPISRDLRMAIYARDGWACLHCGAKRLLSLDHIRPWSRGGPDTYSNLQTLCRSCNSRKGAKV